MTTETKGGFYMTIFEHIFSVIGILIIIGGFIYGIYDSYFEGKGTSSSKASASTSARLTLKHAVAHTRDRGNVRRIHRDLLYLLADICHIDPQNTAAAACIRSPYLL